MMPLVDYSRKPRLLRRGWIERFIKIWELVISGSSMIKLRCPKCGYVWEYRGRGLYYATCPQCLRKVSIAKYRVEGE